MCSIEIYPNLVARLTLRLSLSESAGEWQQHMQYCGMHASPKNNCTTLGLSPLYCSACQACTVGRISGSGVNNLIDKLFIGRFQCGTFLTINTHGQKVVGVIMIYLTTCEWVNRAAWKYHYINIACRSNCNIPTTARISNLFSMSAWRTHNLTVMELLNYKHYHLTISLESHQCRVSSSPMEHTKISNLHLNNL